MATIKSHKDAAYQAAKANDALQDAAKFVFDHCPTVLDGMPDDVKADLNDGWMLRYSEKHPEQIYVRVDGNLILAKRQSTRKGRKGAGLSFLCNVLLSADVRAVKEH
jgi:hypothetical protein